MFGIDHTDCSCIEMWGCGGFSCGDWDEPYCKGDINENITNFDKISMIPITKNQASSSSGTDDAYAPPFPNTNKHNKDDNDDDDYFKTSSNLGQSSSTILENESLDIRVLGGVLTTIFVVGGIVVFAIIRQSRYKRRRIALHGAEIELALELTVNHLDDDNDTAAMIEEADSDGQEYSLDAVSLGVHA